MNAISDRRDTVFGRRESDRMLFKVYNLAVYSVIAFTLAFGVLGIWIYTVQVDFENKLREHDKEMVLLCRGS